MKLLPSAIAELCVLQHDKVHHSGLRAERLLDTLRWFITCAESDLSELL